MAVMEIMTVGPTYVVRRPEAYDDDTPTPPQRWIDTEWLLTNGLGGYAMGSVCACNTRRYHGLLIASAHPPVERFNTIAAVGEMLRVDDRPYELHNHRFTNPQGREIYHPAGWRYLERFEKDQSVRWHYRLGPVLLIKQLTLVWKRQIAELRYRLEYDEGEPTPTSVQFELHPYVALRDFHALRRAEGGASPGVRVDGLAVAVASEGAPILNIAADRGRFVQHQHWWYQFKLLHETLRRLDDTEDLFIPGRYEHTFHPGDDGEFTLRFGIEPLDADLDAVYEARARHLQRIVDFVRRQVADSHHATRYDKAITGLALASDDFVVERKVENETLMTILAGYPWFADWGRDTMIALPGLMLTTGRFKDARSTLAAYARHIRRGLIPNRFDDYGGEPHYNTVDASLWFVHAALEYYRLTGDEDTWRTMLADACHRIITAYRDGTDGDIRMAPDGLISAGNAHTQLTWMDAKRDGVVFTPRHGKAVEINALWYRALEGCAAAMEPTDPTAADTYSRLAAKVKRAFNAVFWSDELGYLYDHVPDNAPPDRSLRPNQVLAVSLPQSPLPATKQKKVMTVVTEKLLTPVGLRTLSPDDPNYHGRYAGSMFDRDKAYHQGTVWAWLIGPYVEGILRAHRFSPAAKRQARAALTPLFTELGKHTLGQLNEVYNADPPHEPDGCIAQAWSVAEVLRAAVLIEHSTE